MPGKPSFTRPPETQPDAPALPVTLLRCQEHDVTATIQGNRHEVTRSLRGVPGANTCALYQGVDRDDTLELSDGTTTPVTVRGQRITEPCTIVHPGGLLEHITAGGGAL